MSQTTYIDNTRYDVTEGVQPPPRVPVLIWRAETQQWESPEYKAAREAQEARSGTSFGYTQAAPHVVTQWEKLI